jgi:alanine racemase
VASEEGIHLRSLDQDSTGSGGAVLELRNSLRTPTLSATSIEMLAAADEAASQARARMKVHLNIDTGMERTGVRDYEAEAFLEKSLACRSLEVEGIYTHFANSESADLTHAR